MSRLRAYAAGALSTALCMVMGCLPIPYVPRATPPIDGLLLRDRVPVSGVRVLVSSAGWPYSHDPWCKRFRNETRTDSNGRFHFDSHRAFRPVIPMGDPGEAVFVCTEKDGVVHHLWSRTLTGLWGFQGVPIPLICELSRADVEGEPWAPNSSPACHAELLDVGGGVIKNTGPYRGGGDEPIDCNLTWTTSGLKPAVTCRDGDSYCDVGAEAGTCTLGFFYCFNEFLPPCYPTDIASVELTGPSVSDPTVLDLPREAAFLDSLTATLERVGIAVVREDRRLHLEPPLVNYTCGHMKLIVPVGSQRHLAVRVIDSQGGIDDDQISFTCVP